MLSRFNNEVLSYGPTAVLPQNLNSTWIKKLQKMTDDFLDSNFTLHECNVLSMDRIVAYKDKNPEFVKILEKACIIRNSEKGWFRNIKEKLLSTKA